MDNDEIPKTAKAIIAVCIGEILDEPTDELGLGEGVAFWEGEELAFKAEGEFCEEDGDSVGMAVGFGVGEK